MLVYKKRTIEDLPQYYKSLENPEGREFCCFFCNTYFTTYEGRLIHMKECMFDKTGKAYTEEYDFESIEEKLSNMRSDLLFLELYLKHPDAYKARKEFEEKRVYKPCTSDKLSDRLHYESLVSTAIKGFILSGELESLVNKNIDEIVEYIQIKYNKLHETTILKICKFFYEITDEHISFYYEVQKIKFLDRID